MTAVQQTHRSVAVTDRSSVGEARRAAITAAQAIGFDQHRRSDIGIVATEAANNILLHGGGGELLVCGIAEEERAWLDLIAVDSGQGIRDIAHAFEDGVSTIGTAGHGLGAMQRLSDSLSLYSIPDRGTVLCCRFSPRQSAATASIGILSIPFRGEVECGDAFLALPGTFRSLYMVVDGLGHGPLAAEAAREAVKAVRVASQASLTEIMGTTHDALRKTRGAAMSISIVDHERSVVTYAGVGNISASVANRTATRSMISQNGTLGAVLPRIQEYTYPVEDGALLLMFSDGLLSKCSFGGYPGIRNRPPALIAGLLYRDFSRKRDDATVLLASIEGARQ